MRFVMANEEKQNRADQSGDSCYNKLVVPIIIAIVAGGSAPWWVEYVKQYLAHPPIPTPSRDAPAEAASKVEIGNFYHRENGCHSSSQTGRFTIENADKLDRTRPGTIQGVTVEVYAANGGQITDAHLENQKVFVVIGTATGGGHWVSNPLGGGPALISARMSTDFFTKRALSTPEIGESSYNITTT